IRIEACLALWSLDNQHSVLAPLVRMLVEKETGARFAAALALAETGYFQPPVDEILRELRQEASDRGKRADLPLRLLEKGGKDHQAPGRPLPSRASSREEPEVEGRVRRPERVERADLNRNHDDALGGNWSALIEEVVQNIRQHSLYREKVRLKDL